VSRFVSGREFASFVLGYQDAAFRLEQRERYRDPEEHEPFRRFLAGEPDYSWNHEWEVMMRQRTAGGERMTRVRVVSEPHDGYAQFLLDLARINVAAGEDIRYLPRDQARGLDVPGYDFWLIDSARVGILQFGEEDDLLGAEVHDDPALVMRHCRYRDVALDQAIPFAEYAG
jgi:hypothetical protein